MIAETAKFAEFVLLLNSLDDEQPQSLDDFRYTAFKVTESWYGGARTEAEQAVVASSMKDV